MEVDQKTLDEVREGLEKGDIKPPDYISYRNGNGTEQPLVIVCKARASEDVRYGNIAANIVRTVPRFHHQFLGICRHMPIAICGGAPSLKNYIEKIKTFPAIMSCGSTHDYLMQNGIVPHWALSVDPQENTVKYFQHKNPNTTYLLASQSHPNMFDWLSDCPVIMWNFQGQVDNEKEVFHGEPVSNWGCMSGINAIQMALLLGYQEHHYFGFDCNVTGVVHAYPLEEWETKEINDARTIAAIGEPGEEQLFFSTTTAYIMKAAQFMEVYKSEDGKYLKGYVYGNGMLSAIIRKSPPEMKEWLEAVDDAA